MYFGELRPEFEGELAASDGRLKIEADDGDDACDCLGVCDQLGNGCVFQGGHAEENGIVTECGGEFGFADGLRKRAADAGDFDNRMRAHFFHGEFITETGPANDIDFAYTALTLTF